MKREFGVRVRGEQTKPEAWGSLTVAFGQFLGGDEVVLWWVQLDWHLGLEALGLSAFGHFCGLGGCSE